MSFFESLKFDEATTPEYTTLGVYCLGRFKQGKGVKIECGKQHVILLPLTLVDEGLKGIGIAYSLGAYYEYNPNKRLNKFILVQRGFPLHLSEHITKIINALIKQMKLIEDQQNVKGLIPNLSLKTKEA